MVDLKAENHIRGERIRLSWTWTAMDAVRPGLKLMRRKQFYPTSIDDGLEVLDVNTLFRAPDQGWAEIRLTRLIIGNTTAEDGLEQAKFCLYFANDTGTTPEQVIIGYFDAAAGRQITVLLADVTRMDISITASPPWDEIETLDIFHAPGGGPETDAGTVALFRGHQDGTTPDRFEWNPSGGTSATVEFQERHNTTTLLTASAVSPETTQFEFETTMDSDPVRTLTLDETYNPDRGEWQRQFTLIDHGLTGEQVYYYSLFQPHPILPDSFVTDWKWQVSAMATGSYGLEDKLYDMLPAVHKQFDEPATDRQGEGQLRSFLQIFGKAADQLRSLEEGLALRHDILNAPPAALPHLARWIGWEPDQTLDEYAQRRDIRMAPEIFKTVGTLPNIRALVNRITGWPCRTKEYVNNILLSNAPETIHLWEIWQISHDGAKWGGPAAVTVTEGVDGRPSALVDAAGELWLFWHADRNGRREIWLIRPGMDQQPGRAALGAPDDMPSPDDVDESPAAVTVGSRIWMFYCSRRENQWDIWTRTFDGLPGNAAVRLTDHTAEDRAPAAAVDTGGQIWLFWQSNRRGPTDIWARVFDGVQWGLPLRITTAGFRHESPSATVDASGRIWLFWSDDLGDRHNIFYRILDGGIWGAPQQLTSGRQRDESPSAVFLNGQIRLFWHSNRDGPWRIWEQTHNGTDWIDPAAVMFEVTGDKEPSAVVTAEGNLSLFFRSRRRGRNYQSRTINTNDPDMLARLRTFEDRAHYTYDAGSNDDSMPDSHRYARGKVGLYLTPDTADQAEQARRIARARDFVEPFRPLPVRFVWLTETPSTEEIINTDELTDETLDDDIA